MNNFDNVYNSLKAVIATIEEKMSEEQAAVEKKQDSYSDYGKEVRNNAKRGIELNEKVNNKCATSVGKVRAQQLADGEAISVETIKRMYSYLSRAEAVYREQQNDSEACGNISYLLWGGLAALSWSKSKLKELGQLEEAKNMHYDEEMDDMMESSERRLQVGDMVSFTMEGETYKGAIEYASDDATFYTVRVYAESNGRYEATDILYDVPVESDIAMLVDEGFTKGMFVSFNSKNGATTGLITSVTDDLVTVEVIDTYAGESLLTGIEVSHPKSAFTIIAPIEVKDRDLKILAKIKEAKMDIVESEGTTIGIIEGLASTYGNTDLGGDIVRKGAFTQTLNHKSGKVLLLFDHGYKTKDIAGVAYLTDSEKGLMLRGEMPLVDPEVKSQYEKLKFVLDRGVSMGLSIGYNTKAKNMLADGRRELLEVSLEEVSITPFPMNTEAQITAAKSRRLIFATKSLLWSQLDAPIGNSQD